MYTALADIGLTSIKKLLSLWSSGDTADSLVDYTRMTRVEPIILIDGDCLYAEELPDVQQSMLSIFAGYYLQALSLSTTVGKINVGKHLDKLNPNRSASGSAKNALGWLLSNESYDHRLPSPKPRVKLALEAMDKDELDQARLDIEKEKLELAKDAAKQRAKAEADRAKARLDELEKQYEADKQKFGQDQAKQMHQENMDKARFDLEKQKLADAKNSTEFSIDRDSISQLRELSNLSVGKMFNVDISDGIHKASVPIAIRLIASTLPTNNLIHILSVGNKDVSWKERWHMFKADQISFIKDLCFCQDLISEHRRNIMRDKDGIYSNLLSRNRENQLAGLVSQQVSIATASNLAIVSSDTISKLEMNLDGKFSDFHIRQKIFQNTYLMIVAVIDKRFNRVTFYHRDIPLPTSVSARDLKAANKGSGPDVSEILRAYQIGAAPSL